jgi:crotonyl-CoA carboxylase/reductase
VVVHHGVWDLDDPWVKVGRDPMLAPSARIWGYETNFGSFGQFAVVQAHQLLPKAAHLSWEEAAAPTLVGTTAYRMLYGWAGNTLSDDDVVLVWGGSGGLGTQAIQLVNHAGARSVAVVSDDERGQYCQKLGAVGYINRAEFDHWGVEPYWEDAEGQREWSAGVRAFGKKLWEVLGERRNPTIVFEHPGEATLATSIFVCQDGGMVVICAGTTGYSPVVDLRFLWTKQKRLQGSHGTNDEQARAYNDLVRAGAIDPCLGSTIGFEDLPQAHYEMGEGVNVFGNKVALIGAGEPGQGRTA